MTALTHDVAISTQDLTIDSRVQATLFDMVLYADDTICVATTEEALQVLLESIEEHSWPYGMNLNKRKCEIMRSV